MLLALLICHLSVTLANPFHKYPYVFLLDVGNEELQNTHTDQIRLSVPGGSVALRYPAIGNGETITHVRVSGIDFGTDLKANILDGGPGYKYVVFVFMGNSGAPYDTVVTLKTISDDKSVQFNPADVSGSESQVSDDNDPNDSAEDFNDDSIDDNDDSVSQTYVEKSNAELTQSSSNVYAYAQKEEVNSDDYDDNNDDDDEKDIHIQTKQNFDQIDVQNVETKDYVEDDDTDQDDENDQDKDELSDPKAEKYSNNDDYAEKDQQGPIVVDRNLYEKYEALKPHLYDVGEVYPQDQVPQNVKPLSEPLDDEDTDEFEQMFNDEEVHNDGDKYRDTNNNNYIDSDDPSAVAY